MFPMLAILPSFPSQRNLCQPAPKDIAQYSMSRLVVSCRFEKTSGFEISKQTGRQFFTGKHTIEIAAEWIAIDWHQSPPHGQACQARARYGVALRNAWS